MTISYQNKTYKLTSELEGAIISFINPEQNYTKYIYPYMFIINIRLKSTQLIITQIFKKTQQHLSCSPPMYKNDIRKYKLHVN